MQDLCVHPYGIGGNVQEQVGAAVPDPHSGSVQEQVGATHDVEELVDEEAEFICRPTRTQNWKPSPPAPSRQEVAEHNIDHWPFRSWCPDCVAGKATGDHHRVTKGKEEDESRIPILAFDYAFMSNTGDVGKYSEVSEAKILVGKDSKSKYTFAIPVPQKGIDDTEWAVRKIIQIIEFLGYKEIIIKVDQE